MSKDLRAYEVLFEKNEVQSSSINKNVSKYRTKTIKSGEMLECEIYPIWNTNNLKRAARQRVKEAVEKQQKANEKYARKKLVRKVNANFTKEDLCLTLTYKGKPPNEEQARKDMQNYIRRLKRYRNKEKMPHIKYVYVIEHEEDAKSKRRIHFHLILNNMSRDIAEQLWDKGYANCRRLQPSATGFEGLVRYMLKNPKGTKRWSCSKNLKEPKETYSDTKISRRKVERLSENLVEVAPKVFCKAYPGYDFVDIEVKYSPYVPGAYIYAKLVKQNGEWIT